ncbi:MAG: GNAT family N-acetyltransferase [Saonia sp.]
MLKINIATKEDLPQLVPLFNCYRVFYRQPSDAQAAKAFLQDRIRNNESIILLALYGNKAVGFTQLFTTFSSVSLQSVFILNDLYVDKAYRKKGVGEALLNAAKIHCTKKRYKGLALETSVDNPAQKLYERLGWEKDSYCFHYFWKVP